MRQTCEYNPEKDISEVDQFGFVNITRAMQNGFVPGSNSSISVEFDDCEDPSVIIGKPGDVFEAMRMQNQIIEGIKNASYNKDANGGSSYIKDEN